MYPTKRTQIHIPSFQVLAKVNWIGSRQLFLNFQCKDENIQRTTPAMRYMIKRYKLKRARLIHPFENISSTLQSFLAETSNENFTVINQTVIVELSM